MTATIDEFNTLAVGQTGVPYVFGGVNLKNTPNPGLDCSGLPYAVSLALGTAIPRTSEAQFADLPRIPGPQRRGDLVFYNVPTDNQPQPAHVSIWWDSEHILQAPHTGALVGIYSNAALPYQIMGYCRLPFPDTPTPPLPPLPLKEGSMSDMIEGSDGKLYICGSAAATANAQEDNVLVFQLTIVPGGAPKINTVTDVTAGIQAIAGGATYRLQP